MKETYFPQEIEKKWQKIWEEKKVFKTPDKVINQNIMHYLCFHTHQGNYTWDM